MKTINEIFKDSFKNESAPQYLLKPQMYASNCKTTYKRPRLAVVLIAAMLVITIGSGSALAYNYASKKLFQSRFDDITNDDTSSNRIIKPENCSKVIGDVEVAVNAITGDATNLFVDITVRNIKGERLLVEDDDMVTNKIAFTDSYIELENGNIYALHLERRDDGKDKSVIRYEGVTSILKDYDDTFTNQEVTIHLSDYFQSKYKTEDIGFKFNNLYEILDKGESCKDFVVQYDIYYALPRGDNKIYFSDKYPTAYIDNYGFAGSSIYTPCKTFYISITPGTKDKKVISELSELMCYNLNCVNDDVKDKNSEYYCTGSSVGNEFSDDGRMLISIHHYDDNVEIDTTPEYLKQISINRVPGNLRWENNIEIIHIFDGSLSMPLTLDYAENKKTVDLNKKISFADDVLTVTKLEFTSASVKIEGITFDNWRNMNEFHKMKITLKDGEVIDVGPLCEGECDSNAPFYYSFRLPKIIDTQNVASIEILGTEIKIK